MRVTVRDQETLRTLRPMELAAYLRVKGWREQQHQARAAVWVRPNGAEGGYEVVLPLTGDIRDFALRMGEVLSTLEVVEGRSQLEILRDLETPTADIVRLRLRPPGANGAIPLESGVAVVRHARDLLLAAACATIEPRAFYQTRKPNEAVEYVGNLQLGQTERGSYVISVVSRVAPLLAPQQGALFAVAPEPFERRVVETLAGSVAAAKLAAERAVATGNVEPFRASVDQGVSANLCDALVGLNAAIGTGVDIDVTWSPTRPARPEVPPHIDLAPDVMPILAEAARLFRETAPREEFELRGVVVRLDRPEGAPTGTATILGFVEDQPRKVRVVLGQPEYTEACRAHEQERLVGCYGDLVKEGRSYVLRNPRRFEVETGADDAGA